MIPTITAFERSPDGGKGLSRDTRVRWALEEVGQRYHVRPVSFAAMKVILSGNFVLSIALIACAKDVLHVLTWVVGAVSDLEAVLRQKLLDERAGAKLFAMALVGAKIVAGDADVADAGHDLLRSEERVAFGAFDIHFEK